MARLDPIQVTPSGSVLQSLGHASLEVLSGAQAGKRLPLGDELYIGRLDEDAVDSRDFLVIPAVAVSRHHARIFRSGENYVIEDLASTNGTLVGARRLVPGNIYPLLDGASIRIWNTRMIFHYEPASGYSRPATSIVDGAPRFDVTVALDAKKVLQALSQPIRRVQTDLQQMVVRLQAMARVSIALGAVKERESLIAKIMECIFDIFPTAERAVIMLRAKPDGEPVPIALRDRRNGVTDHDIRISRSIVNRVMQEKRSLLLADVANDGRFNPQASVIALKLRSVMCAPLMIGDDALGLIQVDTAERSNAFTDHDLNLLTGIGAQIAIALRNFQLYEDIDRLFESFIRASVQTIEARDPVTAGHSFRVACLTEKLALAVDRESRYGLRKVRFNKTQLRELRYAALLHDFGKVTVREDILTKEKKLHPHQMALLEQRFKYARACLEAQAFRRLVERHAAKNLGAYRFERARRRLERELAKEIERLQTFLEFVRKANEPSVAPTRMPRKLKELVRYTFDDSEGATNELLTAFEFSDLALEHGTLTPREREEIQRHVSYTYDFLSLIPWTDDLANLAEIAHGHHEKLDGSGYPRGLRGDAIPIQTRILTIADIYDALSSGDRPYKQAIPADRALDIMEAESRAGKIDKRLLKVFIKSRAYEAPEAP